MDTVCELGIQEFVHNAIVNGGTDFIAMGNKSKFTFGQMGRNSF